MSWSHNRSLVAVVAAVALSICRPAKAQEAPQEPTDVAVTNEAESAAPSQTAPALPDNNWHISITPYLWFAGAHGTAGFDGIDTSYHASFGDVISKFNIGLLGAAELRKNRLLFPIDFVWIKLSDDKAIPLNEQAVTSIKAKLTQTIFTPKVGYRVVDKEKLKVDGTIGIRYWHLGENLSLQPSGRNNSQSANWVDVVAGAKFLLPVSPKAAIIIAGDAGAGAANVDYQVVAALGYKFKPNIIGELGWRYLDVNYRPGSTFVYDGVTSGILVGVTFNLK
jgi:hypothetical protein